MAQRFRGRSSKPGGTTWLSPPIKVTAKPRKTMGPLDRVGEPPGNLGSGGPIVGRQEMADKSKRFLSKDRVSRLANIRRLDESRGVHYDAPKTSSPYRGTGHRLDLGRLNDLPTDAVSKRKLPVSKNSKVAAKAREVNPPRKVGKAPSYGQRKTRSSAINQSGRGKVSARAASAPAGKKPWHKRIKWGNVAAGVAGGLLLSKLFRRRGGGNNYSTNYTYNYNVGRIPSRSWR